MSKSKYILDLEDKLEDAFGRPEYLEFVILGNIRELRKVCPDHILVKAVEAALEDKPRQLELTF